jgi:acylphosphatase
MNKIPSEKKIETKILLVLMAKIKIQISGKVQGVFFRHSARQLALSLNLNGWVKNLPDGSVLCEAGGSKKSLLDFIAWCQRGPQQATVKNVAVQWLDENNEDQRHKHEPMLPPVADFLIVD